MTHSDGQRQSLECPKCSKLTVVHHKGVYQCISCDFKRDLDKKEEKPKKKETFDNPFIFFLVGGVVLLLII